MLAEKSDRKFKRPRCRNRELHRNNQSPERNDYKICVACRRASRLVYSSSARAT